MFCSQCGKQNRPQSNFCRFCGYKLRESLLEQSGTEKGIRPFISGIKETFGRKIIWLKDKLSSFRPRVSRRLVLSLAVMALLAGSTVYAAPKGQDYIRVNKVVKEAKELASKGEYQKAAEKLSSETEGRWTLASKREEIKNLKDQHTRFAEYKYKYNVALIKEQEGNLNEARDILVSILSDYPEANLVGQKREDIQKKIEENFQIEIAKKEAEIGKVAGARIEAERRAQAEAAAKAQAEAQKRAAEEAAKRSAEDKTRADARADAEAKAARDAEQRRRQEELEKERQVKISFLNQLTTLYSNYNNGIDYYNSAMSYYNSGSNLTAITVFGQAKAIFSNTYNSASSLLSTFTGLPSDYISAANNMNKTANYALTATDEMIDDIGSGDSTGNANYYSSLAHSNASLVRNFLTSQGY